MTDCQTDEERSKGWQTDDSIEKGMIELTHGRTDWLTDWLTGGLTDWLTDWLTDGWTDRVMGWVTDWLTDGRNDWQADGPTDGWTSKGGGWQTDDRVIIREGRIEKSPVKRIEQRLTDRQTDGRTDGRRVKGGGLTKRRSSKRGEGWRQEWGRSKRQRLTDLTDWRTDGRVKIDKQTRVKIRREGREEQGRSEWLTDRPTNRRENKGEID